MEFDRYKYRPADVFGRGRGRHIRESHEVAFYRLHTRARMWNAQTTAIRATRAYERASTYAVSFFPFTSWKKPDNVFEECKFSWLSSLEREVFLTGLTSCKDANVARFALCVNPCDNCLIAIDITFAQRGASPCSTKSFCACVPRRAFCVIITERRICSAWPPVYLRKDGFT